MATVPGKVDPAGGEVRVRFVIGDGVIGDWTLRIEDGHGGRRTWSGSSNDRLPDEVSLPAAAWAGEPIDLTWLVVVFGPTADSIYHVAVEVEQGGSRITDTQIHESGTVKRRATAAMSGTIRLVHP